MLEKLGFAQLGEGESTLFRFIYVYDRTQHAIDTGEPYQTLLDPPPGHLKPANWPPHIHPPKEVAEYEG